MVDIIMFARLWGQYEALCFTGLPQDNEISDVLKSYDSEEVLDLLTCWVEEFQKTEDEDLCDFFDRKVKELIKDII